VCRGMPSCPWDVCGAAREADLWDFCGARRRLSAAHQTRRRADREAGDVCPVSAGSRHAQARSSPPGPGSTTRAPTRDTATAGTPYLVHTDLRDLHDHVACHAHNCAIPPHNHTCRTNPRKSGTRRSLCDPGQARSPWASAKTSSVVSARPTAYSASKASAPMAERSRWQSRSRSSPSRGSMVSSRAASSAAAAPCS
jgi:hypothetical protein